MKSELDESKIPIGFYCDGCPYHKILPDRPEQQTGWCDFLNKGDLELNKETRWVNKKTGKVQTAYEIGIPMSTLWDFCKECGINEDVSYD
jgi:hypothetical protein